MFLRCSVCVGFFQEGKGKHHTMDSIRIDYFFDVERPAVLIECVAFKIDFSGRKQLFENDKPPSLMRLVCGVGFIATFSESFWFFFKYMYFYVCHEDRKMKCCFSLVL